MDDQLASYAFDLPSELIAQHPAKPRDHSRLLVYDRSSGSVTDDYFYNLNDYLHPATTLVINNSKVEKARLKFDRFEVFIVKNLDDTTVEALVYPGKHFKSGASIKLADDIEADVLAVLDDGQRRLRFNVRLKDSTLDSYRQTPFPPYIQADEKLTGSYQTIYAKTNGSKAAPTAGLHFTSGLLKKLAHSHPLVEVTLHVGLGTFAPLKPKQLATGRLHTEDFELNIANAKRLSSAQHITAVGTTTARVLESAVGLGNKSQRKFEAQIGKTDIFIRPDYDFKAVDSLITNFHLPKSSLLMLVAAMVGVDEMQRIYQHAIAQNYHFYSFGDAMLIL